MAGKKRIRLIVAPFNYRHSRSLTSVVRHAGVYPVGTGPGELHPDIAKAALEAGAAEPFDATASKSPPKSKARPATAKALQGKPSPQDAAQQGTTDRVDRTNLAAADRASGDDTDPAAE